MFIHCPIIWIKDEEGKDIAFPVLDDPKEENKENNRINEHVKYSIQIKGTRTMPSEYFKTEQEANEYATKIGLKENEYSVIQWFGTPCMED